MNKIAFICPHTECYKPTIMSDVVVEDGKQIQCEHCSQVFKLILINRKGVPPLFVTAKCEENADVVRSQIEAGMPRDCSGLSTTQLLMCQCDGCIDELKQRLTSQRSAKAGDGTDAYTYKVPMLNIELPERPKNAGDLMQEAMETYQKRNTLYGNSYHTFGEVMKALFPQGIEPQSVEDWNRLGVLNMIVSKLIRYTANFHDGGHADSARDLGVYSFMLEELTNG